MRSEDSGGKMRRAKKESEKEQASGVGGEPKE